MARFIIRRFIQALLVIVGTVSLLFFLMRISGDPVALMVGEDASPEQVEQMREAMGLNDPMPVQYGRFLSKAFTLDFEKSLVTRRDALEMVWEALPNTLILSAGALALGFLVAFPVGIYSALRRTSVGAFFAMILALIGQSMPSFWLGIMLILIFAVQFRMLPSFGSGTIQHLILPTVTLSGHIMARHSRLIRSGLLEVMSQDYIRTARAKGVPARQIITRHALKNTLIPIITVLGLDVSFLISGSITVETVFSWPGIGRQLIQAVSGRDYPVVQATIFLVAVVVVTTNFFIDILYGWLDPRISLTN